MMKYDEAFFFKKKYDGLSQINSYRLKNHDDKHIFGGHHFAFQPRGDDPQNHLLAIMAVVCFFLVVIIYWFLMVKKATHLIPFI